jgi:hypothetical protein
MAVGPSNDEGKQGVLYVMGFFVSPPIEESSAQFAIYVQRRTLIIDLFDLSSFPGLPRVNNSE